MGLNDQLMDLRYTMEEDRPANWDDFPDIELYMDQVLTYMERQYLGITDGQITSAMVNNYIKSGMLPRANGKKYSRNHLAYLTAICMLKQVISVSDTDFLIKEKLKTTDTEGFYTDYCQVLDSSLSDAALKIASDATDEDLATVALELAVLSYTQKITCQKLIELMRVKAEGVSKNSEKKADKKK